MSVMKNRSTFFSFLSLSVPVKKEEDFGLQIKEENLRDEHSGENQSDLDREQERGLKESREKKGGRETERKDQSMDHSSKEVRKRFLPSNHYQSFGARSIRYC